MIKQLKELINLLKQLYIRVSFVCCCKSNCVLGRDNPESPEKPEPEIQAHTSVL